jgi:hypothetical protein
MIVANKPSYLHVLLRHLDVMARQIKAVKRCYAVFKPILADTRNTLDTNYFLTNKSIFNTRLRQI